MPIVSDLGGKNYVLGRGRVYFDRFASGITVTADTAGEGERYLGNTPEFSFGSSSEDLDHYSSEGGIKVKDDSVQLSLDREGKFTCDNIDKENIAIYLLGDSTEVAQASAPTVVQIITAKQGRFFQLGASGSLPSGHRKVTITTVKTGVAFADTIAAGTDGANWQVDEDLGRLLIPEGSSIDDDEPVQVTYAVAAVTYDRTVSASNSLYGAIRFVADNPKGTNRDYYLPYVKLSPDGDYNLKGDDWQSMGFTMEVLKKSSNVEAMYVTSRPVV